MRRGSVALLSLALLVASVLLVPALSDAQPGPATGRITYQTVAPGDAETALRNDVIDVYQFGIPRADAQSIGENDPEINLWKGFSGLNDIILNPAPDPSGLNPFSLTDVRYALNFVTNWKHHAEVTLGDLALPMDTYASAIFQEYPDFSDVVQRHNFRYDPELADKLVTAAMQAAGAVKVNGLWEFQGSPVTVVGIVRIEDERLQIGNDFSAELQALGFTVNVQQLPFSSAIPLVYQTDPQAFQWHYYTEGWGLVAPPRYVSDEAGFFGAPAFGNMPGWGIPSFFQYQNPLIDQLSQVLDSQFTSTQQREAALRQVTDLIMQESVRLFGLHIQRVDATRTPVQGVTEDVARGLAHPYLAREVFVPGDTTVDFGLPSLIFPGDAWNPYGGFRSIGSAFPRFAVVDPFLERHPFTQDVIPFRGSYAVLTAGPTGTLNVPPNAVLWDAVGNSWLPVGAGVTAVSRVDFDYSLYTVSNWHHGIGINMADILYGVATAFELAFDPARSGIEPGLAALLQGTLGGLKGLEVIGPSTVRAYWTSGILTPTSWLH